VGEGLLPSELTSHRTDFDFLVLIARTIIFFWQSCIAVSHGQCDSMLAAEVYCFFADVNTTGQRLSIYLRFYSQKNQLDHGSVLLRECR
jgi:hypothetical protein